MNWERPNSLGQTIDVRAGNRPVKIAYLVPFDDSPLAHMVLDAVFYEAYTRWAGAFTLVVPTTSAKFHNAAYDDWLRFFDPDFVYSYVDLDEQAIKSIDRLCSPIALLKHELRKRPDRDPDWRSFIGAWHHHIQAVSSITTVPSPFAHQPFPLIPEADRELTILTQYADAPTNRFLTDNFGTAFDTNRVTHAVPGLFRTLCLAPPDLPLNIVAGSERVTSLVDALAALAVRKAIPIVRFAMAHSEAIPRTEPAGWAYAFRLFIGSTPLDRIHFWNTRHFAPTDATTPNSLIVEKAFFDDLELTKQLGQYLNKHNFLGHGNGPYHVSLHSSSETIDVLNSIGENLRPHTYSALFVTPAFSAPALPLSQDFEHPIYNRLTDTTTFKLTEDSNQLAAPEPAHFIYVPPRQKSLAHGQWIIELDIKRHNNLSKYSNVVDSWVLPRRQKVVRAFTQRQAKVTRDGQLAILPTTDGFPFFSRAVKSTHLFELYLPSDEDFFRHLALEFFKYTTDDLRSSPATPSFAALKLSDKGQNLRGVITMLNDLPAAYKILTNKFWRTVLREAKEESTQPLTFDRDKLDSFLPNDQGTLQDLAKQLRLANPGLARTYIRNSLTDTLEHLIRTTVFYQVAHWRCSYCGHANSRSFDNMRIKNTCDICQTEYFVPIDLDWKYELNDFVHRSLVKHFGLPVLWMLGLLQDWRSRTSYWYLPEVDLYETYDNPDTKNEIDILCMLDGKFVAAEVKFSASMFLNKLGGVDKFLKVISALRPDIAMLSFERYCGDEGDPAATRLRLQAVCVSIRERISPIELEVIVSQDIDEFNRFPTDLGWFGRRTRGMN